MSEVHVRCPKCSEQYTFPDGTQTNHLKCEQCGGLLTSAKKGRRPATSPPNLSASLGGMTPALAGGGEIPKSVVNVETVLDDRGRQETSYAAPITVWVGWTVFAAILGVMVLASRSMAGVEESRWLALYATTRNGLLLVAGLLVIHEAWQEGVGQGILCLLLPPYLLLYAIAKMDSFVVRGLIFGLLCGLMAEAWLMPANSLAANAGPTLEGLVDRVNQALAAAKA